MTRSILLLTLSATVFGCLPLATAAQAQNARPFVSVVGSDSNANCTVTSPCRHLQNAYNVTSANGEIDVLDGGNFGSLTISQPVSIYGGGQAWISPPANGSAIAISGSSGTVNLRGLILDGHGASATSGISFANSSGTLNVQDSVIRNFGAVGLSFEPNAAGQIFVSNTLISDNAEGGVTISAGQSNISISGTLDHVECDNNGYTNNNAGIVAGSVASGSQITLTVSDSLIARNNIGIVAQSVSTVVIGILVRNSTIANQATYGLVTAGSGTQTIWVTRSAIYGNGTGMAGGGIVSYSDNVLVNNTTEGSFSSTLSYQ